MSKSVVKKSPAPLEDGAQAAGQQQLSPLDNVTDRILTLNKEIMGLHDLRVKLLNYREKLKGGGGGSNLPDMEVTGPGEVAIIDELHPMRTRKCHCGQYIMGASECPSPGGGGG